MEKLCGDDFVLEENQDFQKFNQGPNVLVSCVIGFDERLQPSMTLINTNVFFATKANLCCHTNSLSMKHANAPKSISV